MSGDGDPRGQKTLEVTLRKVHRHLRWSRTEGVGKLVEEDGLNPLARMAAASRRRAWRRSHPRPPGQTTAVFVLGAQRSGTNMLVRALGRVPGIVVVNENDRHAFHRFQLRDDERVRALIATSRFAHVVVKPLCESHRADVLLGLGGDQPAQALWVYRNVDDRVRSAVAKFGDVNLRMVEELAANRAGQRWYGQRLPAGTDELLAGLDVSTLSSESGAALFWWLRNSLWFELGLDRHPRARLIAYEQLVTAPREILRDACTFIGAPYEDSVAEGIEMRHPTRRPPLQLDPAVRGHCDELQVALDAASSSATGR